MRTSWFASLALVASLLLLAGCGTTAQGYVDEHSAGYYIVKGRMTEVQGLDTGAWEALSDGMWLKVARSGCQVRVHQEASNGSTKETSFELAAGDVIIFGDSFDYLLASVDQQREGVEAKQPLPAQDEGEGD